MLDMTIEEPWTPQAHWSAVVARACEACARDPEIAFPEREISVLLTDDAAMQGLNRQWRGFDKPTNVLSFPGPALDHAPLGDVAIAHATAAREAQEEGKTLEDHVSHLTVHGVLHLLGFDHETEEDARVMEAAERRILASMGIADPYPAEGSR